MDNFQIETAQNIHIQLPIASLGDRIVAFLLDMLIQGAYWLVLYLMVSRFFEQEQANVIFLLASIPSLLYFFLFENLMHGRTPGKAALKLRVVRLDGERPAAMDIFIRWVLRLFDITLSSGGVAILVILLNGKGQRLGDIAAGTSLISELPGASLEKAQLVLIKEDHQPLYPQVTRLSDPQAQQVKLLLEKALSSQNYQAVKKLAEKVATLLEVPVQQPFVDFLKQVLKDYVFYTQKKSQ